MKDWIPTIGALLGVILGGAITWLISRAQFKRQDKRERNKLILEKLEEIHKLVGDLEKCYAMLSVSVMKQPNLAERVIESEPEVEDLERIKLLTSIYAPELADSLAEIDGITERFSSAITPWLNTMTLPEKDLTIVRTNISQQGEALMIACDRMRARIIEISKNYT
jgi:hypothetical protein